MPEKPKSPKVLTAWLRELGKRGGKSKSPRKIAAARESMGKINERKARAKAERKEAGS